MAKHVVSRLGDFPLNTRRIVNVADISLGVFNIRGEPFELRNSCPHEGAPLCLGRIKGTNLATKPYEIVYGREDEIIKCPWHGWEFEIATGRSVFNPRNVRVPTYEVTVEGPDDSDPTIETFSRNSRGGPGHPTRVTGSPSTSCGYAKQPAPTPV